MVLPQRVQHSVSSLRVVEPTTPSQMAPNSHRILQTSHRMFVTPATPYPMVRRSAGPHNLSQDMLEETVQPTNHIFPFPIGPSVTPVLLAPINKQVIIMREMANAFICPDTGTSLKHNELIKLLRYKICWMRSTSNESERLVQGIKRGIKGINTIKFIRSEDVQAGRKVTYGSFVVYIKAHKEETECTHLTVGGDQIEYPGNKSTRTTGITTGNLILNSTISTPGARFLVIKIIFLPKHPPRKV
jgi:hypothetical protein